MTCWETQQDTESDKYDANKFHEALPKAFPVARESAGLRTTNLMTQRCYCLPSEFFKFKMRVSTSLPERSFGVKLLVTFITLVISRFGSHRFERSYRIKSC